MKRCSRRYWRNASCRAEHAVTPEGSKRKMSGYQLRPRKVVCNERIEFEKCIRIVK